MREPRRRPQQPSPAEIFECVRLACYPRDECPDPRRLAELNAKVAAWEADEERRKDPVGALCKKLNAENPGVSFSDVSRYPEPIVRVCLFRGRREYYEPQAGAASLDGAHTGNLYAKIVHVPAVELANDVSVSSHLLTDKEWDHDDEIREHIRARADELVLLASPTTAKGGG